MNLSSEPILDPEQLPPPRFRRRRRVATVLEDSDRVRLIEHLAKRVSPTFEFFLFSLLAGAIFGAGWLLDGSALIVLGALLSPFIAPAAGLALASAIGSWRFWLLSLGGLMVGSVLVFVGGLLAGFSSFLLPFTPQLNELQPGILPWDVTLVLILGMLLTCVSLVKREQHPALPSAAVAYALYARVSASGYLIASGNLEAALWQLELVGLFLLAAISIGMITFMIFGFRPARMISWSTSLIMLIALLTTIWFERPVIQITAFTQVTPAPTVTILPSRTPASSVIMASATPTNTPSPQWTETPTNTIAPTLTATITPTFGPTPIWARVSADGQNGARLRDKPGFVGKVLLLIDNGMLVKLLPEVEFKDKVYWAHVETIDGTIGWMVHTVLITPTPAPKLSSTPQ